jgi:hypothetical protein
LEQQLVTQLADRVNKYHGDTAICSEVGVSDGKIDIAARAVTSDREQRELQLELDAVQLATTYRRKSQRLAGARAVRDIRNSAFRLERQLARLERGGARRSRREDAQQLSVELRQQQERRHEGRLGRLRQQLAAEQDILHRVQQAVDQASSLEEEALMRLYTAQPILREQMRESTEQVRQQISALMMELYLRSQDSRHAAASVVILGPDKAHVFALADAYQAIADAHQLQPQWHDLLVHRKDRQPAPHLRLLYGGEASSIAGLSSSSSAGGTAATSQEPSAASSLSGASPGPADSQTSAADEAERRALIDVRRVGSLEHLRDHPDEDRLGVALYARGGLAPGLLGPEQGVHEFRRQEETSWVLVETRGSPLAQYEPPLQAHSAQFYSRLQQLGHSLRRKYDYVKEQSLDVRRKKTLRFTGDVRQTVTQLIEEQFMSQVEGILEPWK